MEIYETDFEELYSEALREHFRQNVYFPPIYPDLRNVSSLNLDKIFTSSSSVVTEKIKHVSAKRKGSGDFNSPYSGIQEVNYHKIVIEKCNKNKAVMCKPICQVSEKVEKVTNTEEQPKKDSTTEPHIKYIKPKDVQNQTSKLFIVNNMDVQTENGKGDGTSDTSSSSKNKKNQSETYKVANKHTHKSTSSSSSKDVQICLSPLNFDETVQSLPETENKYAYCRELSKMSCSCQTGEIKDVKNKQRSVNKPLTKNISIQKEPRVTRESKKKMKKTSSDKSSDSSHHRCCCKEKLKKKKCFCFKKRHHKENDKDDVEKSIQTRKLCCSDKCYQVTQSEYTIKEHTRESRENSKDTIESNENPQTHMCCKKCKKCCKSCTKNKIVLPPKPLVSGDQADTLKTLIKMEAKQNYRQVNIILQELSEQKSEIKKLLDLYQGLSRNVSGNRLDKPSLQGIGKPRDYFEENKFCCPQKTHTVNICEGCGLHFYRDLFDAAKTGKSPPFDSGDKIENDQQTKPTVIENIDSDKQIRKTTIDKSTPPSKVKISKETQNDNIIRTHDMENIILPSTRSECVGHQTVDVSNINKTESVLTLYMEDKPSQVIISKKPNNKVNKPEISDVETNTNTSNSERKLNCKSKSKAFINWCKKSIMSIKERECNKFITEKIKRCRETDKARPKKSIFAYFLQYCKYYLILS